MAQLPEASILARVRFGSSRNGRRGDAFLAKTIVVMGIGMILLLVFAAVQHTSLLIIGMSLVLFGISLLMLERLMSCARASRNETDVEQQPERRRQERQRGQRDGNTASSTTADSQNQTHSRERVETNTSSVFGPDIWTSGIPMDMAYVPPHDPPPVYSLTPNIIDEDVDRSETSEESGDVVSELPVLFPLHTRRRFLSTPPLPSYDEVIELDRLGQTVSLSSSLPALSSSLLSQSTSTITTPTAGISGADRQSVVTSSANDTGQDTSDTSRPQRSSSLPHL